MRKHVVRTGVLLSFFLFVSAIAKDTPFQVITWPPSGSAVVRFSFGKLKEVGSVGHQRSYLVDVTAENLWGKPIKDATFSVYFFDKAKARIGEGYISLNNVAPGEVIKLEMPFGASGVPASMALDARSLPPELGPAKPPRTVTLTVNSVP